MRPNPVRAKLKAGATAYGIMAAEFFTPGFCQIVANAGAEFVIFDGEHGGVGIDVLKAQIAFARGAGISILLIGLGVLGGVLVFGFIGIFLGPVLLALGHMLFGRWTREENPA